MKKRYDYRTRPVFSPIHGAVEHSSGGPRRWYDPKPPPPPQAPPLFSKRARQGFERPRKSAVKRWFLEENDVERLDKVERNELWRDYLDELVDAGEIDSMSRTRWRSGFDGLPPAPRPVPWLLRGERGAWITLGVPTAGFLLMLILSSRKKTT